MKDWSDCDSEERAEDACLTGFATSAEWEVILGVRQGDGKAREQLFRWLLPLIQKLALEQTTLSYQAQQDLVGQVVEWLVRSLKPVCEGYAPARGTPRAYFRIVLRRLVLRYLETTQGRWQRREVSLEARPEEAVEQPDPEASVGAKSLEQGVLAFVGRLKEKDERLFYLSVVEERPAEEVALELGIKTDAVYKRAERLRERLSKVIRGLEKAALVLMLLCEKWF